MSSNLRLISLLGDAEYSAIEVDVFASGKVSHLVGTHFDLRCHFALCLDCFRWNVLTCWPAA